MERVELVRASPWWGEHRSRYHWAGAFAAGEQVLDVACGTGFGLPILAEAGANAGVGIDLASEAVQTAKAVAPENFEVLQADAGRLPCRDGSFSVVTSFETIEHLKAPDAFLHEVHRVLEVSGRFFVSTPNALISRPIEGIPRNPFHVREYEPDEFRDLLAAHFADVEVLGQSVKRDFGLCPVWSPPSASTTERIRRGVWTGLDRTVPFPVKNRLSRLRHGRGFYPGEFDFDFTPDGVESCHVIVGSCRK
jgi:SAM-dependent methyltransferase